MNLNNTNQSQKVLLETLLNNVTQLNQHHLDELRNNLSLNLSLNNESLIKNTTLLMEELHQKYVTILWISIPFMCLTSVALVLVFLRTMKTRNQRFEVIGLQQAPIFPTIGME